MMWNLACEKAGLGAFDEYSGRHIYHLHSLRKFFRTKIGLDVDKTHSIMGHAEYLDEVYLREHLDEIMKEYLEAMPNVSIYEVESQDLKDTVGDLERRLKEQREFLERVANISFEELSRAVQLVRFKEVKNADREEERRGHPQKVIKEDEIQSYLDRGWVYLGSLNNGSGKCIVAKP